MAGIPMAYGIPFWAVTAVIYILAIGGVIVGIAFMLRGILLKRGVSFSGGGGKRIGDVKVITIDEGSVNEMWAYYSNINNVLVSYDPKRRLYYFHVILPNIQPLIDSTTGAPVYFSKAVSVVDRGSKVTLTIHPRDIITDAVITSLYAAEPVTAVVASSADGETGAVSAIPPDALNSLISSIESRALNHRSSAISKVIDVHPNIKIAIAGTDGAVLSYIVNKLVTHVSSFTATLTPILESVQALKKVKGTGMNFERLILLIGALIAIYMVLMLIFRKF
jgi:hypothetical protein